MNPFEKILGKIERTPSTFDPKLTYCLNEEIIHDPPYNPWGLVREMERRLKEEMPFIDEIMEREAKK